MNVCILVNLNVSAYVRRAPDTLHHVTLEVIGNIIGNIFYFLCSISAVLS
jgi:hypothetical protein